MLIVCSGPDTFRALEKALELELAFKQKYDAHGLSVERLSSGKDAVAEIASRAGSINLFAPRRFVRTANLLSDANKAQRVTLSKVLAGDQDGFIVLTLEEESPTGAVLKELGTGVKVIKYDFPYMSSRDFFAWATQTAAKMGLQDVHAVREIAEAAEGDSWSCYFELMKRAASSEATLANRESGEGTIFAFADAYLRREQGWRHVGEQADVSKQVLTTFLTQVRAAVRVRDGAEQGLHPFVAKKLRGQRFQDSDELFARVVEGFFVQRSGFGDDKDVLAVL